MKKFLLITLVFVSSILAQRGDRKGHVMVDPIPADKIPAAPVLNEAESLKSFKVAEGFTLEVVAFDDMISDQESCLRGPGTRPSCSCCTCVLLPIWTCCHWYAKEDGRVSIPTFPPT